MKKNFTLLVLSIIVTFGIARANSLTDIHHPIGKYNKYANGFHYQKAGDGKPNEIYFALAGKIPADSPFAPIVGSAAKVVFDKSFSSDSLGPYDSQDFNSGGIFGGAGTNAFAINQGGVFLSIKGRQLPTVNDTIQFTFQNPTLSNYQLQIDATPFQAIGLDAYLRDNYLNKNTLLPNSLSFYNFTVSSSNVATFFNRFSIVFKSSTLAINSISLSSILNDNTVTLNWKTVGESNLTNFSIEKSVDGVGFSSLGSVAPKNVFAASYSFIDPNVSNGNSYYRIKTTDKVGRVSYSTISSITKGGINVGFGVYPNPIQNKLFNIKFNQIVKGEYSIVIHNSLGKQVYSKQIQHNGGTATYSRTIDAALKNGLYKLTLHSASSGNAIYTTNILVNN